MPAMARAICLPRSPGLARSIAPAITSSPRGAPQLQHRALPGYTPEEIPAGASSSKFTPPANTGDGYLDAVTDDDLLAMADPSDADGDGISGVPNRVAFKPYLTPRSGSKTNSGLFIGRFGKKAGAYNLLQQTAGAYNQDMGITSSYEPFDTYSGNKIEPEVTNQTVQDVVFYLRTLKAPVPRDAGNAEVTRGKELFMQANCGKCHMPELRTGASDIAALAFKTFYPYTDLLMHDMGSGLDDAIPKAQQKPPNGEHPRCGGSGYLSTRRAASTSCCTMVAPTAWRTPFCNTVARQQTAATNTIPCQKATNKK